MDSTPSDKTCRTKMRIGLHWAAQNGLEQVVQLLVNQGVALDMVDSQGATALHIASKMNKAAIVGLLADAGADLNAPLACKCRNNDWCGGRALHFAALAGGVQAMDVLLNKGADINAVSLCKYTPCISRHAPVKDQPSKPSYVTVSISTHDATLERCRCIWLSRTANITLQHICSK